MLVIRLAFVEDDRRGFEGGEADPFAVLGLVSIRAFPLKSSRRENNSESRGHKSGLAPAF
jgi:hypothetical protein